MNKYKINDMLIRIKEKKQTVRAKYVVVLSMQKRTPLFLMESSSKLPANFSREIRRK